jgi:hypothetical protein
MKHKILYAAMLAGLGAGSAQAVHINPDGLGQVLLYPYYTVENSFSTNVHVVNTTSAYKAVKVRFLEGMNSQEVFDFNLYLSPYDEWAGAVSSSTTGGAKIVSGDTSCIAPRQLSAAGEEFRDLEYKNDTGDDVKEIARVRTGHVEIIEMGNIVDSTLQASILHNSGAAPTCTAIVAAAINKTGPLNLENTAYITAPSGGLYGFATVINVDAGLRTTYDAVTLDNFRITSAIHYVPGNTSPSLSDANTSATVLDGTTPYVFTYSGSGAGPNGLGNNGVDMVSALLMRGSLMNDYVIDAARASKTDWVITFPTKAFYVNLPGDPHVAVPPFAQGWGEVDLNKSCDEIHVSYWDREEKKEVVNPSGDFSPSDETTPGIHLCKEVNTLTIKHEGETVTGLFGANEKYTGASFSVKAGYDYGWAQIDFAWWDAAATTPAMAPANASMVSDVPNTFFGLPVIGFAAVSNTNDAAKVIDGVNTRSNYMGNITHKYNRVIDDELAPLVP